MTKAKKTMAYTLVEVMMAASFVAMGIAAAVGMSRMLLLSERNADLKYESGSLILLANSLYQMGLDKSEIEENMPMKHSNYRNYMEFSVHEGYSAGAVADPGYFSDISEMVNYFESSAPSIVFYSSIMAKDGANSNKISFDQDTQSYIESTNTKQPEWTRRVSAAVLSVRMKYKYEPPQPQP